MEEEKPKLEQWRVFKDLSLTKERLIHAENTSDYKPHYINKTFSYFLDTIFHANEINMNAHMDNLYQYEYYFKEIKPKKRYQEFKKPSTAKEEAAIAAYYDYNLDRVREVLPLLKPEQLKVIIDYAESLKQINTS